MRARQVRVGVAGKPALPDLVGVGDDTRSSTQSPQRALGGTITIRHSAVQEGTPGELVKADTLIVRRYELRL